MWSAARRSIRPSAPCLEAFSALNNPRFGNPNGAITNPAVVGTINSAAGNRTVQLGGKFQF